MNKKSIIALLLSLAMTLAACGDDDSSSEDESSVKETTQSSATVTVTEKVTEPAESSTLTVTEASSSVEDTSSEEEPETSLEPSEHRTVEPAEAGELINTVKQLYSAQDITGSDAPHKFNELSNKAGIINVTMAFKTKDLFDPFDDLLDAVPSDIEGYSESAEVFCLSQIVDVQSDHGADYTDNDGQLFVICLHCNNAASAALAYKEVVSDNIRNDLKEMQECVSSIKIYDDDSTNLIASISGESVGVYIKGSDLYMIGSDVRRGFTDDEVVGGKYTAVYNYAKEADKICKALGLRSPSLLDSMEYKKPEEEKNYTGFEKQLRDAYFVTDTTITEGIDDIAEELHRRGKELNFIIKCKKTKLPSFMNTIVLVDEVKSIPEDIMIFFKPDLTFTENDYDSNSLLLMFEYDCGSSGEAVRLFTEYCTAISENVEKLKNVKTEFGNKSCLLFGDNSGIGVYLVDDKVYYMALVSYDGESVLDTDAEKICGMIGVKSPTKLA